MTNRHLEHALDKTPEPLTTTPPADDLVVTTCPDHGVKVTTDAESHRRYVANAHACREAGPHDDGPGLSCWVCCDDMVIDPAGLASDA